MATSEPDLWQRLFHNKLFFICWCTVAAFGVYFCTYAFRKPFNTGTYDGYALWGLGYKTVLIVSQIVGYILSKYSGIKLIAELKPAARMPLLLGLILFAELALLGLGVTPFPYNFIFMFLNGLPLGLIFGIVFSFLEGRRVTEILSVGLSISMIVSSGLLKSVYLLIQAHWAIHEFWLPAVEGLIFLPLFLLFAWMLAKIPPPTAQDVAQRTERQPMSRRDRRVLLRGFGIGIFCMVCMNALLTACRDFRDDFMVEIASQIGLHHLAAKFSLIELSIAISVLILIALLSFIRSNRVSFSVMHLTIFVGLALLGGSSVLFMLGKLSPLIWFVAVGFGLFLPYILIQSVYFDRFIALFRVKANAGFLIYLCDAMGYSFSIGILLYRSLFMPKMPLATALLYMGLAIAALGILLLGIALWFFSGKQAVVTVIPEESAEESGSLLATEQS